MNQTLSAAEKHALTLHGLFALASAAVLALPGPVGIKLLALVLAYNIALPLYGIIRHDRVWLNTWAFCMVLSVFQVFPDWFLSEQLKVLVFPEDGLFRIGSVSGYMAGLWTIPFFIIIYGGRHALGRFGPKGAALTVALLSLLIFGLSEMTVWMLPSWYAVNLKGMAGHVALYILIPEVILGLAAYYAGEKLLEASLIRKTAGAFLVMLLYLGSAAWFYFIIERVIL